MPRGRPRKVAKLEAGTLVQQPMYNIQPAIVAKLVDLKQQEKFLENFQNEFNKARTEILDIFFPCIQVSETNSERKVGRVTTPEATLNFDQNAELRVELHDVGLEIAKKFTSDCLKENREKFEKEADEKLTQAVQPVVKQLQKKIDKEVLRRITSSSTKKKKPVSKAKPAKAAKQAPKKPVKKSATKKK